MALILFHMILMMMMIMDMMMHRNLFLQSISDFMLNDNKNIWMNQNKITVFIINPDIFWGRCGRISIWLVYNVLHYLLIMKNLDNLTGSLITPKKKINATQPENYFKRNSVPKVSHWLKKKFCSHLSFKAAVKVSCVRPPYLMILYIIFPNIIMFIPPVKVTIIFGWII